MPHWTADYVTGIKIPDLQLYTTEMCTGPNFMARSSPLNFQHGPFVSPVWQGPFMSGPGSACLLPAGRFTIL